MKKLFSRQSILPDRTNHYDEYGHKVGYSRPSLLGTYTNHYDEYGHKVGYSREGLFGTVHYDENGHKVGVSHDSTVPASGRCFQDHPEDNAECELHFFHGKPTDNNGQTLMQAVSQALASVVFLWLPAQSGSDSS